MCPSLVVRRQSCRRWRRARGSSGNRHLCFEMSVRESAGARDCESTCDLPPARAHFPRVQQYIGYVHAARVLVYCTIVTFSLSLFPLSLPFAPDSLESRLWREPSFPISRGWKRCRPTEPIGHSHPVNHGVSLLFAVVALAGACYDRFERMCDGFSNGSEALLAQTSSCLLYTSPSPRDS